MSVILSSMLMVFGSYIAQPDWFNNGPFEFHTQHETLAECQIATHGTSDICVGESPSSQYRKSDVKIESKTAELNFVECDYWAGCYIQE
jgi:hypothetical protein